MKANYKKLILVATIVGVILMIELFNIDSYLTFENLKMYKEQLLNFVGSNYLVSVVGFIAVYILVVAFSLPGAAVLSLACGFFFGMTGVLYVNIGATFGAVLAFLAARYIIGNWIQGKYGKKMDAFNRDLEQNGKNYLLTLRLVPVFPFFLINLLAGLTGISLFTFFWTTALGIVPGSIVYVYAGTQLSTINSMGDIISWQMLSAFALLGLLSLVPVLIQKIKSRKEGKEK